MPSSCKDIRTSLYPNTSWESLPASNPHRSPGAALVSCLQSSPCVLIERNKPADCLRHPLCDSLPMRCQQLKHGYTECRRGMVDMRKRFRGNQPIGVSQELETGGGRGQLYAGKGALSDEKKQQHREDGNGDDGDEG